MMPAVARATRVNPPRYIHAVALLSTYDSTRTVTSPAAPAPTNPSRAVREEGEGPH